MSRIRKKNIPVLIDNLFVTRVKSCTTIPPVANADHCGLTLTFSISSSKKSTKLITRQIWRYSSADWDRAAEMLDSIEWDNLLPDAVDQYWSTWKHYFLQVMEICIPHAVAKTKRNPPWITN